MDGARAYRRREAVPEAGLFAVADVHGDFDALSAALSAAPAGAVIVFLGDLVDRGPYSPLCAERVLELSDAGRAVFVAGNHDAALIDVVDGRRAPTPRRVETLEQFDAYGGGLLERYCAMVRAAPLCLRVGRFVFVHAAWKPEMETAAVWGADLRRLALLGERRAAAGRRRPETVYRWVDRIRAGDLVMVGHDVRAERAPLVATSRHGGAAAFLDLGCGKGGRLGCARIQGDHVEYLAFEGSTAPARSLEDED